MNEPSIRPTKKQRELLEFIETFIAAHGYSPSYREIMEGLNYTSVATVALHVNSLIKRGHIKKRDHAARSLEVIAPSEQAKVVTNQVSERQEKWLIEKVGYFFHEAEQIARPTNEQVDQLYVLIGSLKVLGLEGAAHSFLPRLAELKQKLTKKA